MEQNKASQAFTISQTITDIDLNNVSDPPTGVRSQSKPDSDGSKTSTVNFVIYIPNSKNTKPQDAPHTNSMTKMPKGKDCYSVYINYLHEAFITNEFLLCKETLELFTVVKGLVL